MNANGRAFARVRTRSSRSDGIIVRATHRHDYPKVPKVPVENTKRGSQRTVSAEDFALLKSPRSQEETHAEVKKQKKAAFEFSATSRPKTRHPESPGSFGHVPEQSDGNEQDTCTLFTLLSVSQLLTQQFEEGPQLRRMFADAVVHLADFNKTGDLPADDRESVVNTFEVAMELWGKCSVEEVVRASKEIRDGKHSINDLFLSVLQSEEATTREETETAQPNAAS